MNNELFAPLGCVEPSPVEAPAPSATPPVSAIETVKAVQRVHFAFTGDEALLRDFERTKELSRHKWPTGKMEDVFAGAMRALLDKIDPDKRSRRKDRMRRLAAGARSRHIDRGVKAEVWLRDGGRGCSSIMLSLGRWAAARRRSALRKGVEI